MKDDDRTKNDLTRSKRKAIARVERQKRQREVASAVAAARRDKLRSVSKGDTEMQEDPIVAIAKA
jgi:hypothetical protein